MCQQFVTLLQFAVQESEFRCAFLNPRFQIPVETLDFLFRSSSNLFVFHALQSKGDVIAHFVEERHDVVLEYISSGSINAEDPNEPAGS